MRLLLISTCGATGVVALATEAGVLAEEPLPGRGASEALMPALRSLMSAAGWSVPELDAVVVVNGPGSFTGVRVGLAAAKGLCDACGLRLIALSRLALLARSAAAMAAVLDAGRGEYFVSVFEPGVPASEELLKEAAARQRIEPRRSVACEPKVAEALGVRCVAEPGADAILALALEQAATGSWSDVALTDANYLRRTDAELKAQSLQ